MTQTPPTVLPELLTPAQLSIRINIKPAMLTHWRRQGLGPAYVKLGETAKSRVRYPIKDVIEWENSLPRHTNSVQANVEAAYGSL